MLSRAQREKFFPLFKQHGMEKKDKKPMTVSEFLSWSFQSKKTEHVKKKEEKEILEQIFHLILEKSPSSTKWSLSSWKIFLEDLCAQKNRISKEKQENKEDLFESSKFNKIHFGDLSEGLYTNVDFVYILGWTDPALKNEKQKNVLSESERFKLSEELGFPLSLKSTTKKEFEWLWLMEKKWKELILSYPETNFFGQVQAPHRLWIKGVSLLKQKSKTKKDLGSLHLKTNQKDKLSRPFSLNQSSKPLFSLFPGNEEQKREERKREIEEGVKRDCGKTKRPPFGLKKIFSPSFFVTTRDLELFDHCPFVYAASKLFQLKAPPSSKAEIDPRSQSQLLSRFFFSLSEEKAIHSIDIEQALEKAREDRKKERNFEKSMDPRLWPLFKGLYQEMGERFLKDKEQWQRGFTPLSFSKSPLELKFHWDLEKEKFFPYHEKKSSVTKKKKLLIQSRIHAVKGFLDEEKKSHKFFLFEWTSSSKAINSYKSWIKKDVLHLPLSVYILQNLETSLPPGEIVAAYYFYPFKPSLGPKKGLFFKEAFLSDLFQKRQRTNQSLLEKKGNKQISMR